MKISVALLFITSWLCFTSTHCSDVTQNLSDLQKFVEERLREALKDQARVHTSELNKLRADMNGSLEEQFKDQARVHTSELNKLRADMNGSLEEQRLHFEGKIEAMTQHCCKRVQAESPFQPQSYAEKVYSTKQNRRLADLPTLKDKKSYIGLTIKDKKSIVSFGPNADVNLARIKPGELLIDAKSVHTKSVSAQSIKLNNVDLAVWKKSIDDWKNKIVNEGILVAKGLLAHYNKDIIVDDGGKNPNTYFPVVFSLPHDARTYNMRIFRRYNDKPDTDKWYPSSKNHHAALNLDLEVASRSWGGFDHVLSIKRHVYTYEPTIESAVLSSPTGYQLIIYMRGGGGRFHLEGNLPSIMSPKVYHKTTTIYQCCNGKYKTIVSPKKSPKKTMKEINTGIKGLSEFKDKMNSWQSGINAWKNKIVNEGILVAKGLLAHYNKDIIVDDGGKNPNTYFPVVFSLPHDARTYNMRIFRRYNDKPDTDKWYPSSKNHHAALNLDLEVASRSWGGFDHVLSINRHVYTYEPTIESVALSSPTGYQLIIYMRGGGGRFHLEGNLPSIMSPKVYHKTTTIYQCCKGKYKTIVSPKKSPKSTLKEINTGIKGLSEFRDKMNSWQSGISAWQSGISAWKNKIVNEGILVAKGLLAHYNKDIIVDDGGKNPHTYFPVVFSLPHDARTYNLRIFRRYNDRPDTDKWYPSSKNHHAALNLNLEVASRSWGGFDHVLTIKRHVYTYTPTIESAALASPTGYQLIIYMRGGGGRFHLEGDLPSIMSPKIYHKTTTIYQCCSGKYKTIVSPRKNPKSTLKEINPIR